MGSPCLHSAELPIPAICDAFVTSQAAFFVSLCSNGACKAQYPRPGAKNHATFKALAGKLRD